MSENVSFYATVQQQKVYTYNTEREREGGEGERKMPFLCTIV